MEPICTAIIHGDRIEYPAAALRRLAALPNSSLPDDPGAWQREIRADRPLFGRDD